jgi:hypothetical protein
MRKLIGAVLLVVMVLPAVANANTARTRALAGGDARLLPDDSQTAEFFPGRIHEHQRITFENVAPTAGDPVRENRETWAGFTAEFESLNGATAGWFVNRPHAGRSHQLISQGRFDSIGEGKTAHSQVEPAGSLVDLFYGNESWGFTAAFGTSSEEIQSNEPGSDSLDLETDRNYLGDFVFGKNFTNGMELGVGGFVSHFGELDLDDQNPTAIGVNANIRKGLDWAFFNHFLIGGGYLHDLQFTNDPTFDGRQVFNVDANLFNFTEAPGVMEGAPSLDDLTYLLSIGAGYTYSKEEGNEDSDNLIVLPKATAGAELGIASWLTARGSVNHQFFFNSGPLDFSGDSVTLATLGAALHWGRLSVDMVINNRLLSDGPDFIGGREPGPGLANFVTIDWAL